MRHFETETELARRLALDGHVVWLRLEGGSMAPGLRCGDEVGIAAVATRDVEPGDVIAYRRGGKIITHALRFSVGLGRWRWLFLKGSANERPDPPVGWGDVVGRVTAVRRADVVSEPVRACSDTVPPMERISTVLRALRGLLRVARPVKELQGEA